MSVSKAEAESSFPWSVHQFNNNLSKVIVVLCDRNSVMPDTTSQNIIIPFLDRSMQCQTDQTLFLQMLIKGSAAPD